MSIPVLTQVYEELRRLAIAGSSVAAGDFRLKKLIAPLEQAGAKAPVFAKVAEAAGRLVESKDTDLRGGASGSDVAGRRHPLHARRDRHRWRFAAGPIDRSRPGEDPGLGTRAQAVARSPDDHGLRPNRDYSRRPRAWGVSRSAFDRIRPSPRWTTPTRRSANSSPKKVLPLYGPAILPELRAKFDPKGRLGHARRLLLMHRLDPEATREQVKLALDEGSKEVRIAAIECLGHSPEDLPFLLEQVKSKAKDVRCGSFEGPGQQPCRRRRQDALRRDGGAGLRLGRRADPGQSQSRADRVPARSGRQAGSSIVDRQGKGQEEARQAERAHRAAAGMPPRTR